MGVPYLFGGTSNLVRFKLRSSSTGLGLTGLTGSSSGLIISTICDNEATATTYTQAATHIQTISTLGTFSAPSASNCRFGEVDSTNQPGLYEFQIADARFAVSSAKRLVISVTGASGLLDTTYEIDLVTISPFAAGVNVTSINSVAASGVTTVNAIQGLSVNPTFDSNNFLNVNLSDIAGVTVSSTTAQLGVNVVKVGSTTQTARDLGASVLLSPGTGTGQLSITSGVVQADAAKVNGVATTSVTTIAANVGTTQPVNFTGTGGSALAQTDVTDWKGSAAPAMTGDAFARLGAPAGASVSADIAAVKGVLPTALTGGGNIKADAVAIAGSTTAATGTAVQALAMNVGTVNDTSPAAGSFKGSSGLSSKDNEYKHQGLVFSTGANQGICRSISGYVGSTKTFSFTGFNAEAPFPAAPANGDQFMIIGLLANST